jgi:hypothetical protein
MLCANGFQASFSQAAKAMHGSQTGLFRAARIRRAQGNHGFGCFSRPIWNVYSSAGPKSMKD